MTPKQILTILLLVGAGVAMAGWITAWGMVAADPHGEATLDFKLGGLALVIFTFTDIAGLITVALDRPHCTLRENGKTING